MQADISNLPSPSESVYLIFAEGVLHHTNSTEASLKSLARLLRNGGRFLFYVYRRKGPLREFTDDYIRVQLQNMSPEQAWRAMEPLTRLGIALGELNVEVNIPEPIDLLKSRLDASIFNGFSIGMSLRHSINLNSPSMK